MIILDGKTLSKSLNKELEKNIFDLHSKPRLSIILVGNRPDSLVYVNMKKKKCQELGIEINVYQLDDISIYFSIINKILLIKIKTFMVLWYNFHFLNTLNLIKDKLLIQ